MGLLKSTKASLWQVWKERDIQITVLVSFTVQLFLLFTGNRRRHRTNGFLRFVIWLAYVGADAVAIFAIGLFTEEKYNLGIQHTSGDEMLPFLWAPFLLLHLRGQDTITAFSIEDNNLWLRHLLNLVVQVTLTLYVLWRSFEILDLQLLAIALPIFVAGTIKYGERTWALFSGSRDYLGGRNEGGTKPLRDYTSPSCGDVMATYALNTVLRVRGLLVGRTLFQLGHRIENELVNDFEEHGQSKGKLKIVIMELGMIYDLLYTKAMVLQSRTGCILRCIAEMCMVVAFVLFLTNRKLHTHHDRVNIAITYTLFVGAMYMEAYSVSMVIVSPWTRASSKKGSFLYWLSDNACWLCNVVLQRKKNQQQQLSMGQFNLTDYCMYEKCMARLISKVITTLGLQKKWRNIWHIQHIKVDKEMSDYIERLLCSGVGSQQLNLGGELNYVLSMPFEHALFRLHIFTDMHLSSVSLPGDEIALLMEECRKLSQYLIYLMAVYPSMLPVSNAAQDIEYDYAKWARNEYSSTMRKQEILKKYADEWLCKQSEPYSGSPFDLLHPSVESLTSMKEVWVRLLIYAAGKCPAEIHARQLGDGLELLTAVWLLMVHHGVGDVGRREVNLLSSDVPDVPTVGSLVPVDQSSWIQRHQGPLHAFEFHQSQDARLSTQDADIFVAPWAPLQQAHGSRELVFLEIINLVQQAPWAPLQQPDLSAPMDNSPETTVRSEIQQDGHVALQVELDVDEVDDVVTFGGMTEHIVDMTVTEQPDISPETGATSEEIDQDGNMALQVEQDVDAVPEVDHATFGGMTEHVVDMTVTEQPDISPETGATSEEIDQDGNMALQVEQDVDAVPDVDHVVTFVGMTEHVVDMTVTEQPDISPETGATSEEIDQDGNMALQVEQDVHAVPEVDHVVTYGGMTEHVVDMTVTEQPDISPETGATSEEIDQDGNMALQVEQDVDVVMEVDHVVTFGGMTEHVVDMTVTEQPDISPETGATSEEIDQDGNMALQVEQDVHLVPEVDHVVTFGGMTEHVVDMTVTEQPDISPETGATSEEIDQDGNMALQVEQDVHLVPEVDHVVTFAGMTEHDMTVPEQPDISPETGMTSKREQDGHVAHGREHVVDVPPRTEHSGE